MSSPSNPVETAELVPDLENKFNDEPKEGNPQMEELDDAVFVEDKGDGTTTLMKPQKPTLHHRGRDSHFNMDGIRVRNKDPLEELDDYDDMSIEDFVATKWYIVANSLFVFSSTLYLAMAVMVIDTYWFYKDTPRHVYWADDDATWWNYFVNCTDDGFLPENVTEADDDYTWMEWYNTSAFASDDHVWLPAIADQDAPFPESYVSKYMILYFFAALGFVFSGIIEAVLTRKSPFWIRCIYYVMILASCFGLVAAILTNKAPEWAAISSCVSVNLWALESIIIVLGRIRGVSEFAEVANYDSTEQILGWSISKWFWVADISFMIGTWGDAITAYFYVFQYDNWMLGISAIIFAFFWLLCAIIYFSFSIYDYFQFKRYMDFVSEYEKELKDLEGQGIVVEKGGLTEKEASQNTGSKEPSLSNDEDEEKKIGEAHVEQSPEQAP